MTPTSTQSVLIVGGGPAGLTAAYRLLQRGHRVTMVDRRAALGGKCSETFLPQILLGCHRASHALLRALRQPTGIPAQTEIPLEFLLPDRRMARYPRTSLPAPAHSLCNILRFSGMPWRERWRLASWLERIWEGETQLPDDLEQRTADDWLNQIGQTPAMKQSIWNPLARWLTGNDLQTLSADALVTSLRPFFLSSQADSRLTMLQESIQAALIRPLTNFITQSGATIRLGAEATQLRYTHDHVSGVHLRDGAILEADWYLTAVSPQYLTPMLPERWLSRYAYFQQLAELTAVDQNIVQVITDRPSTRPRVVLLPDSPFHWFTATAGERGHTLYSFVSTATSNAPPSSDIETTARIPDLLRSVGLLPAGTRLESTRYRTTSHAALLLKPGTKSQRPIPRSPIANLLVAGAWTDTGWPCTFESAVESGNRCAEAIQEQKGP